MLEPCIIPALEEQAIGCAWGKGQTRPVVVKRFHVKVCGRGGCKGGRVWDVLCAIGPAWRMGQTRTAVVKRFYVIVGADMGGRYNRTQAFSR